MSEASQLLKGIRPLKLIVNPLFFVTVTIKNNGFSTSNKGVLFIFCFVLCAMFYKSYRVFLLSKNGFEEYLDNYGSFGPMVLCILSYVCYFINSKGVAQALCEITAKADLICSKNFNRRIFKLTAVQVITCHSLPIASFFWLYYAFPDEDYSSWPILVGETFISYFIVSHFAATSLIFSNAILFCWRLVAKVNKRLQQPYVSERVEDNCFIKQERVTRICVEETVENLVREIKIYDSVCQWCVDFNELFGLPLAACCISNLISMTLYAFFLIKYGLIELWLFLFGFSYCILQSWLILYACEKCKKEMLNTGMIVSRLVMETKNPNRKEVLQQFSILLLHRKVKFTACGLFDLNYKLIYSALAAVAAYLAVAFQFEIATKSLQRFSNNATGAFQI